MRSTHRRVEIQWVFEWSLVSAEIQTKRDPRVGDSVGNEGTKKWKPCGDPPSTPLPGSQFCASRAYESSQADELSVPAGARVRVLEMSDRGWWLCRCAGVGLWQGVSSQG